MEMLLFLLALADPEDHERITDIYYRYHEDMMRYARGRLSRTTGAYDAEDAVQNAFLSVQIYIHNIDFWDDAPRLRRYLLSCVRNEIVKLQSKAVYCEDIDLHVNALVSDDDFINAVDEEEDYHRLVDSIRKLPERYGHLMYLRWVEGMTVKEIAERTEIQTATVYKTLERGKLLLLKQLREDGIWIAQMQPN